MSNLENVSFDKLETDIMSVLYANMDIKFSQYALFNKVLADKYSDQYTTFVHPNFKSKFILILRNLMSKYNDIQVTKENNEYSIMCVSSEKPLEIGKWKTCAEKAIPLEKNDFASMYDYIYDNDMIEYINYIDPFESNTIYHDLVLFQNANQIQKLISADRFNYFIKNSNGKTPIELSESQIITNILSIGLMNKYQLEITKLNSSLDNNLKEIAKSNIKISYLESKEYKKKIIENTSLFDFLYTKLSKTYCDNKLSIIAIVVLFFLIKFYLFV